MTETLPPLVSTQWLAEYLAQPGLLVLDASRHLPATARDPQAEFVASHIPGARFLDLASLKDTGSSVPDAIPTHDQLMARLKALGWVPGDAIILYDDSAIRTSARAWFTLMAYGIERVAILDGGLGKWRAEERALESGQADIPAGKAGKAGGGPAPARIRFKADLLANIENGAQQVVDARAADRVFGDGIDPVHGGPNGRIPGALNVPFGEVFRADGTYKSATQLRAVFEAAAVDWQRPVITTCGSGMTASVLLFALHLAGKDDTALYDGSWSEWAADPATPKAQGPA